MPCPPRKTGCASSVHPLTGMRSHSERTSSTSAPSVDERAERHVAGDPGEAVVPGGDRHFSIRNTALAAPKPLSMPTTVMPAAHDASIASSAVMPSSAAP